MFNLTYSGLNICSNHSVPLLYPLINSEVCGKERGDVLAGEATNDFTLTLDPPTVLTLLQEHIEALAWMPATPPYT